MANKNLGFRQEGYQRNERYKVVLPQHYFDMYHAAKRQASDALWGLLADRGREFPSIVEKVSRIDLDDACSADIGALVSYFAHVGISAEDSFKNIRLYKVKKGRARVNRL